MVELCTDDATANSVVSDEYLALWRSRSNGGLLAWNKRRCPVMGIDGRRIDVPPEPEISRETGRDAIVVLRKQRVVPCAQMRDIR